MWPPIAPGDGMALDIPASAFPSALFSPEDRHFQEVAPAQLNHSPEAQAGHLPSFQERDGRRCCSPGPCILLTLGANLLQFLGTSHSYQQTHGASRSLQPTACLQRAERPQLISHLPQGPGAYPGSSRRAAAMLGAPHPAPAPLAWLLRDVGALLRLLSHRAWAVMDWWLETPEEAR